MLEWFFSFSLCIVTELYLQRYINLTATQSNLIACIFLQSALVFSCINTIYNIPIDFLVTQTLSNLNLLRGYFVYDVLFLLENPHIYPAYYILHHVISLFMLNVATSNEIEFPYYYNAIVVATEITGPFLNLRYLLKNTEYNYHAVILLSFVFGIFRIIIFPIVSVVFLYKTNIGYYEWVSLFSGFVVLYCMSWNWFLKIIDLPL